MVSTVCFIIVLLLAVVCSYVHNRNVMHIIYTILFVTAIYSMICCCIFPIQYTRTSEVQYDFGDQFSIMPFQMMRQYLIPYFKDHIEFLISFYLFALSGTLLYEKMQRFRYAAVLLVILLAIHIAYNVILNTVLSEIIKYINAEDILLMTIGYLFGWSFACLVRYFYPVPKEGGIGR